MTNENNLKKSVISGVIWKFIEVLTTDGISFVVSVVLARLLSPDDYGEIALVNVFIVIANVFVVNGLGTALIQKKEADSLDFSSVFYFNFAFSLTLYGIIFLTAPALARFYETPHLAIVLRVLALRVPIASINSVQNAYVSRQMAFKKVFWASLIGTVLSGAVGIAMALAGYGVWALVGQVLFGALINTIVMFVVISWRPTLEFSWQRLKSLVDYGWKILASSLIKVGYEQLSSLIIGKLYTTENLAHYTKGKHYPELVVSGVNSSISSVLFPAFSKKQTDLNELKQMVRRSMHMGTYVLMPLLFGLAALAKPFISFLLTDKWLPCAIFLQISCIYYAFQPVQTANLQAIRAIGRSDVILILDIIKRGVGLLFLLAFMHQGVLAVAIAPLVVSFVAMIANAIPNRKFIKYRFCEQLSDLLPNLFLSLLMAIAVYFLSQLLHQLGMSSFFVLLISFFAGVVIYILESLLTRNKSFFYILRTIKEYLPGNRK